MISGQVFYFCDEADAALADYLATRHYLELGKTQAEAGDLAARAAGEPGGRVTLDEVCNRYVAEKIEAAKAKRLTEQTLRDYKHAARLLLTILGRSTIVEELTSNDFARVQKELHKGRKLQTVKNLIVNIKIIFNFAFDRDLILAPMKYGREFHISKREVAKSKVDEPTFFFSPEQLRELYQAADTRTRAMLLLGINGALGNRDVALMRERHIDFENGWVNYPRRKTGQPRAFPLWPETVEAIREAIKIRPVSKLVEDRDCIFIGRNGFVMQRDKGHGQIKRTFRQLLDRVGDFPAGAGFYSLRRTFVTIARKTGRSLCVKYIAGHAMNDITDGYDCSLKNAGEVFDPAGLVEVILYVRAWLFESSTADQVAELPSLLSLETQL